MQSWWDNTLVASVTRPSWGTWTQSGGNTVASIEASTWWIADCYWMKRFWKIIIVIIVVIRNIPSLQRDPLHPAWQVQFPGLVQSPLMQLGLQIAVYACINDRYVKTVLCKFSDKNWRTIFASSSCPVCWTRTKTWPNTYTSILTPVRGKANS
jgi:hypothetical protein